MPKLMLLEKTVTKEKTFIFRLKIEYYDLRKKIKLLSGFINENPIFLDLENKEKDMLKEQIKAMNAYKKILKKRYKFYIKK